MEMLPPTLMNQIGMAFVVDQSDGEYGGGGVGVGNNASMGLESNRLPVRRRLFSDELSSSSQNSSPSTWLNEKLSDMFVVDKERALAKWGFDITTDTPSTSSSAPTTTFKFTVLDPSEVPSFYTHVRGCRTLATFTPKTEDRSSSEIFLLPISLPSSPFAKQSSSSSSAIIRETTTTSMISEREITESMKEIATSASTAASSSSSSQPIIAGDQSDATPLKPKGKKKSDANNSSISGQTYLPNYFSKKRSSIDSSSSATPGKKRAIGGGRNGIARGGQKSNGVRQ